MSNTSIQFPQGPFVDLNTGQLSLEWFMWLQNPQVITINIGTAIDVPSGGTGLTGGTSGGILGFVASDQMASSGVLGNNSIVIGGGAGFTPSALASTGTTTTVLHGNASGPPTFAKVNLTTDTSGNITLVGDAAGTGPTSGNITLSLQNTSSARGNLGLGNVSTINLNGNGSTVLAGNGSFFALGNASSITLNGNGSTALRGNGTFVGIGNVSQSILNGNTSLFLNGNGAFTAPPSNGTLSTRQVFLTGTSATYNTPGGARQLVIYAKGAGGGGSGTGSTGPNNGGAGNTTIFNSINATGGAPGINNTFDPLPGAGGTGGSGSASVRLAGSPGSSVHMWLTSGTAVELIGGSGGGTGGGKASLGAGSAGVANSGGGGAGGGVASQLFATASTFYAGAGGGEGEYIQVIITSPSSTYTYTVGAGGTAGSAGTSGNAGGTGGSGYIVVDEFY